MKNNRKDVYINLYNQTFDHLVQTELMLDAINGQIIKQAANTQIVQEMESKKSQILQAISADKRGLAMLEQKIEKEEKQPTVEDFKTQNGPTILT